MSDLLGYVVGDRFPIVVSADTGAIYELGVQLFMGAPSLIHQGQMSSWCSSSAYTASWTP
jgi:hypothetical protein